MLPNGVMKGLSHSSSSSGKFFQTEGQSLTLSNSQLSSSFGNSSNPSSLVTDANSCISGSGPYLQRSASINNESHTRLPASPLSFSSNNMDGSSVIQQNSNQDCKQHFPLPQNRSLSVNISHLEKKARVDIRQEDIMQQLLQRQDSIQNPQLQALIQQQQILQAMRPAQRAQLLQQQQQMQLRQQIQQQAIQSVAPVKRPSDSGVCSRRLMQYLYHQRQRPADNTIAYWRKFVSEYFSPRAKKRWCLSSYENVGHHSLGVFPQTTKDAWQCDICSSKSGKGFEATFEVLPRLNEIKFGSGVIDELLYLDFPRECRFPSGIMMLEYSKAVQESVYEQLRVVREGQLRIIFAPDLKILSWEFCARRHEELLSRKLVAPQVNQLLQVAQKCQKTISESGPEGVSQQDLQTNSNMVVTAGRQLARTLELSSLNDLGFSKRYVRCLQISEVVYSMKDLMHFCRENKVGPIEGLKTYPQNAASTSLPTPKIHENEQLPNIQGLVTDRKMTAFHPSLNIPLNNSNNNNNNNYQMPLRGGGLNSPAQSTSALANYQNILRQNSTNSNSSSLQQEGSSSFNTSNQNPGSIAFQGPTSVNFVNSQVTNQYNSMHQHLMHRMMQNMSNSNNITVAKNGNENVMNRSNSFKSDSSAAGIANSNTNVASEKASDFPQMNVLEDDVAHDIACEFSESGFFSSDFDGDLDFGWNG